MHETELCITKLFNDYLAGLGNTLTGNRRECAPEPRPWANFVTMQILVALIHRRALRHPASRASRPTAPANSSTPSN